MARIRVRTCLLLLAAVLALAALNFGISSEAVGAKHMMDYNRRYRSRRLRRVAEHRAPHATHPLLGKVHCKMEPCAGG